MAQAAPMPMCPMAETCRGMMERPLSGLIMLVPGITFITLGVLIIVWPSILPWLVAAACILAGGGMLLMANFMRGVGTRLRSARG
ncbi:MAG TPA: hypothetical protein VFZ12_06250 [Dehalococcoidia bacterium]|jgi:hypothetical protein|nr:hypothetical protein [Dehalococcoidia bacterium]